MGVQIGLLAATVIGVIAALTIDISYDIIILGLLLLLFIRLRISGGSREE